MLFLSHRTTRMTGTASRCPPDAVDFQNLSTIIPLGILHLAQHLHDRGFLVRVVRLPHEFYALQRLGLAVNRMMNPLETILSRYPARICGIQAHFYLYCGGFAARLGCGASGAGG